MSKYQKNLLLHLTVLLGCILPFGSILGPLFFKTSNPYLLNNRKFILRFQILWTILFLVMGVFIWLHQIQLLASGISIESFWLKMWVAAYLLFAFIYPIINMVIISSRKSQYLLCYPRIGK